MKFVLIILAYNLAVTPPATVQSYTYRNLFASQQACTEFAETYKEDIDAYVKGEAYAVGFDDVKVESECRKAD